MSYSHPTDYLKASVSNRNFPLLSGLLVDPRSLDIPTQTKYIIHKLYLRAFLLDYQLAHGPQNQCDAAHKLGRYQPNHQPQINLRVSGFFPLESARLAVINLSLMANRLHEQLGYDEKDYESLSLRFC